MNIFYIFFLAGMFSVLSSGCSVTLRNVRVNDELFSNPKMFVDTVKNAFHRGMSEQEFFKNLGIDADSDITQVHNLEILDPDETWKYVYGRTEVRAAPEEIERHKNRLIAPYVAYRLPYRNVKKLIEKSFDTIYLPNAVVRLEGHDLSVVAVFENGALFRAPLEGRAIVNTEEEIFIWDLIGDTVGGAVSQGGKEVIRMTR